MLKRHFREVLATIKIIDIEERFDIYFSRFVGLFFARWSAKLSLSPTHVTLASMVTGAVGGGLLYWQKDLSMTIVASLLITLAGILDSADGQLARMTGKSTDLGRMIDGIADNMVFISCYVGATAYWVLNTDQAIWMIALAAASGYFFSLKAALYEFYKTEYLQLIAKQKHGNIPLYLEDFKVEGNTRLHRFIYHVIYDYTRKQLFFTTRTKTMRQKMQRLSTSEDHSLFDKVYKELNKPLMFWWALFCGANTHRTLIIVTSLFGRFDLYLIASICWTVMVIPVSLMQKNADQKLEKTFFG